MDKIILGLLMFQQLTIYELRNIIEVNFTSMCSDSMGSIQAAIKKLLEKKLITYQEYVENSINKKAYSLTDGGKECFYQWVQTSMIAGKVKDMELSKLFFMGFVPRQKRISLIEAYISDLRKELQLLQTIKDQDHEAAKLKYLSNPDKRNNLVKDQSAMQSSIEEIIDFQLSTLQFGIDRINFEISWFQHLKARLANEQKCSSETKD